METDCYHSHSEDETHSFGKQFAEILAKGDIVALLGDLGAGKTEFVKGVCDYFQVEDIVSSPTFTIMNQYFGTDSEGEEITIYHVDLYRIDSPKELIEIGFDDCMFSQDAIKFVEWPEKAGDMLPDIHWTVDIIISPENDNERIITIRHPNKVMDHSLAENVE
ncbi:MAG: tRNA (adenosine(37)-N6)-threonylcarbamoyltransferase complex ATPase subunit type 1 TsaE [Ignavibacteriae bacterium]|nr:tRNA (adenosine(37)-N6)-threonylcarbamoyltransferase complex ATPase subunit type 1 TsaE [Ignavibacteriota bacterium]